MFIHFSSLVHPRELGHVTELRSCSFQFYFVFAAANVWNAGRLGTPDVPYHSEIGLREGVPIPRLGELWLRSNRLSYVGVY